MDSIPSAPSVGCPSLMLLFARIAVPLKMVHLLPEVLVDVVAQQRGVTTHVAVAVLQAKLRGTSRGGWGAGEASEILPQISGGEGQGHTHLVHVPPCGQKNLRHLLVCVRLFPEGRDETQQRGSCKCLHLARVQAAAVKACARKATRNSIVCVRHRISQHQIRGKPLSDGRLYPAQKQKRGVHHKENTFDA